MKSIGHLAMPAAKLNFLTARAVSGGFNNSAQDIYLWTGKNTILIANDAAPRYMTTYLFIENIFRGLKSKIVSHMANTQMFF